MKKLMFTGMLAVLVLIGCTSPQVVENPPGSGQFETNYVVSIQYSNTIAALRDANAATAPINPYSPLLELGLTGALAVAAWWARMKSVKAKAAEVLLTTVIQGVENAAVPEVKKVIATQAKAAGVGQELASKVLEVTGP